MRLIQGRSLTKIARIKNVDTISCGEQHKLYISGPCSRAQQDEKHIPRC
jgi:hypothetical protein